MFQKFKDFFSTNNDKETKTIIFGKPIFHIRTHNMLISTFLKLVGNNLITYSYNNEYKKFNSLLTIIKNLQYFLKKNKNKYQKNKKTDNFRIIKYFNYHLDFLLKEIIELSIINNQKEYVFSLLHLIKMSNKIIIIFLEKNGDLFIELISKNKKVLQFFNKNITKYYHLLTTTKLQKLIPESLKNSIESIIFTFDIEKIKKIKEPIQWYSIYQKLNKDKKKNLIDLLIKLSYHNSKHIQVFLENPKIKLPLPLGNQLLDHI